MATKVVLAYSGGLDTSVAIPWLKENYDAEVITLTADMGGGSGRSDVQERAIAAGASKAFVVDGRQDFVRQFVFRRCRPAPFTRASTRWPPRWGARSSHATCWTSRTARARVSSRTAARARATTRCAST